MNKKDEIIGGEYATTSYGNLVVVDYINAHKVLVEFVATKYRVWTSMGRVRSGGVKDKYYPSVRGVGYLGEGDFTTGGRNKTAAYRAWEGMLNRCYISRRTRNNAMYEGCSVHPDWFNFQTFAKWYEEQNPPKGYHLDKDTIFKGNRVYSAKTCCFIPARDNIKYANDTACAFTSPSGVYHTSNSVKDFADEHGLDPSALCKVRSGQYHHHKGWTLPARR